MDTLSNLEVFERIAISLLVGSFIGLEREWSAKPAGVRTYALVCEGAALFMITGLLLGEQLSETYRAFDPSRIASTVAQGIGFVAAGVIFSQGGRISGLTTAAGIWVTAALGLLIGGGFFAVAVIGVATALFVLLPLRWVEGKLMSKRSKVISIEIGHSQSPNDPANV